MYFCKYGGGWCILVDFFGRIGGGGGGGSGEEDGEGEKDEVEECDEVEICRKFGWGFVSGKLIFELEGKMGKGRGKVELEVEIWW